MKSTAYRLLRGALFAAAFTFASASASAATLVVSADGVFPSNALVSPVTAPGGTWSFSFHVDQNPVPISPNVTNGSFTLPFTNFVYRLNGVLIAGAPDAIILYSAMHGGGMDLRVNDQFGNWLVAAWFYGDSFFSGPVTAPTIELGVYPTKYEVGDAANMFASGDASVSITLIPLPAGLWLLLGGIAALSFAARRNAASSASA